MKPRRYYSVRCIILIVCALALAPRHMVRYVSAAEGYSLWNRYGLGLYAYLPSYGGIIPGQAPLVDGESIFTVVKRLSAYPPGARRFTWTPSQVYQVLAGSSVPWTGMPSEGFMAWSPAVSSAGWPAALSSASGIWSFYRYQWGMNPFSQTTGVYQGIYGLEPYEGF
ncbi:MAG: hypothetical protein ACMUIS_06035 [bacterium]